MKKQLLIRVIFLFIFLLCYYLLQVISLQWDFLVSQFIILLVTVWIMVWFLIIYFYLWKKLFNKNKKYLSILYYAFIVTSIFWFILPWMFLVSQLWKIKVGTNWNFPIYEKHNFIQYKTEDNITIDAVFLDYQNSQNTIIFSHWLWANKKNFYEYARSYYYLWYNVLIFDFRWHGQSQWQTTSFWYNEAKDIFAWYNYLKTHYPEKSQKIIWVWYSMWAAATIFAQEKYKIFDKIILDSPYASLNDMIKNVYGYFPNFYQKYLSSFSNLFSKWLINIALLEINPWEAVKNIQSPILLFHCKEDSLIPMEQSKKIIQDNPNISSHFFDNCSHVQALNTDDQRYLWEINFFLTQ